MGIVLCTGERARMAYFDENGETQEVTIDQQDRDDLITHENFSKKQKEQSWELRRRHQHKLRKEWTEKFHRSYRKR